MMARRAISVGVAMFLSGLLDAEQVNAGVTCDNQFAELSKASPQAAASCLVPTVLPEVTASPTDKAVEALVTYDAVDRTINGLARCQVRPSLSTYFAADGLFSGLMDNTPRHMAGHELGPPRISSVTFLNTSGVDAYRTVRVRGTIHIEKRAKYKYPCVKSFRLKWCDGWTRLYETTANWTATVTPTSKAEKDDGPVALRPAKTPEGGVGNSGDATLTTGFRSSVHRVGVVVPRSGVSVDVGVSNDLARLALAVQEAFGTKLIESAEESIGNAISNDYTPIDLMRNLITQRFGNTTTVQQPSQITSENQMLTALLNGYEGKEFLFADSTPAGKKGRYYLLKYEIAPENLPERTGGRFNALAPTIFCACEHDSCPKKTIEEEFRLSLDRSTRESTPPSSLFEWSQYEGEGYELFGRKNLARLIEEYRGSTGVQRGTTISADNIEKYVAQSVIASNFDSLTSLWQFYDMSDSERRCTRRLATQESGSPDLIYPGQDFTSCLLDEEAPDDERARILDELTRQLDESGYWNELPLIVKGPLAEPMQRPNYRGWYYCYINRNTCGTNALNSIKWDAELSRFNGRLNQHKGIDIFAGNHDASGGSQLQAVAAGKMFYRSVQGWGNTVFLPFTNGGDRYYAVYAHLPDSAKALDGRVVASAESLGSTGCSGNAGNTQGKCNDYCEVDGTWRSDQHLHFEILDIAKGNKPVDPETMLPSKPTLDMTAAGMKLCSRCKNGNCTP